VYNIKGRLRFLKFECRACKETWYTNKKPLDTSYYCPSCGETMSLVEEPLLRVVPEEEHKRLKSIEYRNTWRLKKLPRSQRRKGVRNSRLICYKTSCKRRANPVLAEVK
jgi:uncharacterized Zn finger protein (UPF0148 family)